MPDAKASTANQTKLKLRPADLWQMWTLVGYGLVMAALVVVGVLSKRSASEISYGATVMLMGGWGVMSMVHIVQLSRIAKLEQRLAESESSRHP